MIAKYIELISQALSTVNQGNIIALAALFLVLSLGEFGVPFPFVLQGVLFFIGYQISQGAIQVIPLVLILVLGRQFGSAIVYWLARLLGDAFTNWLEKHFRSIRNELDRLEGRLRLRAPLAVAIGRLTPGLLVPTSLASGAIGLRYEYFALGIALSAVIWDGTFIASGVIGGCGVQHLGLTISPWLISVGFITTICLTWAVGRCLSRRKARCER